MTRQMAARNRVVLCTPPRRGKQKHGSIVSGVNLTPATGDGQRGIWRPQKKVAASEPPPPTPKRKTLQLKL